MDAVWRAEMGMYKGQNRRKASWEKAAEMEVGTWRRPVMRQHRGGVEC